MNRIKTFDEYRALVDVVKMHDYRYFGLNNPTISDEEYGVKELKGLVIDKLPDYGDWV